MNKTNRVLSVIGLAVGGLALMSNASARRTKETERLQAALFLNIEGGNEDTSYKNEFKQKVLKMSHNEMVTLYTFMITHEGDRTLLSVPLRAALRDLQDKYNLFG